MRRRLVVWLMVAWIVGLTVGWVVAFVDHSDVMLPFGPAELLFMAVGGFLMRKGSGGLIGPVMFVGASAGLVYDLGTVYAGISMASTGSLPFEHFAAWLGMWTGPFALFSVPLLLVLFPEGSFHGGRRWWIPVVVLVVGATIVGAALMWTAPTSVLVAFGSVGGPPGYPAYELVNVGFLSWYLFFPAALTLVHRYWRGSYVERLQIRWLLASVLVVPPAAFIAGRLGVDGSLLLGIAPCAIPLAIGVAVTRYRLYDLGRVLSRTVTYAIVAGILAGFVALAAALAGVQFESPIVVAGITLGVAAVFNPLRRRVQQWVDRRFNRAKYDAELVMGEFTGALRDKVEPDEVIAGWVGVVRETMHPSTLAVWTRVVR